MRMVRCLVSASLMGLLAATASPTFAGDDDAEKTDVKLPKAVKKTVKTMFPKAKIRSTSTETDDEGETLYEVELTVDGKAVDLLIDEEGEIEEIEREIDPSDLPSAVTLAVQKAHPKAKIEKAEEVTLEGDKVLYELAIKTGEKEVEVAVAPNGKILETEDDEMDDDEPKAKKKDSDKEKDDDEDKD